MVGRFETSGKPKVAFNLDGEDADESNEARGIWYIGGKAWKVFAPKWTKGDKKYKDSLDKQKKAIAAAQKKDIPIAKATTREGRYYPRPGDTAGRLAYAVVTNDLRDPKNRFFSMQGKSGPAGFKKILETITNEKVLKMMEHDSKSAVEIKLSDPQGFVDGTNAVHPMQFIDLHIGKSSTKAEEMVDKIAEQLKKLPGNGAGAKAKL